MGWVEQQRAFAMLHDNWVPRIDLRQYTGCHPAPNRITAEDYALRLAIETQHADLDGIPIVPATLVRSDDALRQVAEGIGPEAGEVFVEATHKIGNQSEMQSRAHSSAWRRWRKRAGSNGR